MAKRKTQKKKIKLSKQKQELLSAMKHSERKPVMKAHQTIQPKNRMSRQQQNLEVRRATIAAQNKDCE